MCPIVASSGLRNNHRAALLQGQVFKMNAEMLQRTFYEHIIYLLEVLFFIYSGCLRSPSYVLWCW